MGRCDWLCVPLGFRACAVGEAGTVPVEGGLVKTRCPGGACPPWAAWGTGTGSLPDGAHRSPRGSLPCLHGHPAVIAL